jgi:hypothetical protein
VSEARRLDVAPRIERWHVFRDVRRSTSGASPRCDGPAHPVIRHRTVNPFPRVLAAALLVLGSGCGKSATDAPMERAPPKQVKDTPPEEAGQTQAPEHDATEKPSGQASQETPLASVLLLAPKEWRQGVPKKAPSLLASGTGITVELGLIEMSEFPFATHEAAEAALTQFPPTEFIEKEGSMSVSVFVERNFLLVERGVDSDVHALLTSRFGNPSFKLRAGEGQCESDTDCVPEGCCHALTCNASFLRKGCLKESPVCASNRCADSVVCDGGGCLCLAGTCAGRIGSPR